MSDLRAIWALARLDLKRWFKSPAAIASALLPPLGMALLLAVLSLSVTEQPVALVIEAHGPYALRMEQLIRADEEGYFLRVTDAATANRFLREQKVAAIITIPEDFDRKAAEHDAILHLKLNNVDIDFADDIRRSVERSAGQFDAPKLGLKEESDETKNETKEGHSANESRAKSDGASQEEQSDPKSDEESGSDSSAAKEAKADPEDDEASATPTPYAFYVEPGNNPYHIAVEEHDLRVTNVDFLHYQLIPVLVLLVLNIGMTGTALLCASDGERGTARLLIVSPVSSWALVIGRLLGGSIASLIVLIPVVGLCVATRTIVVPDNHWGALTALFLVIALCAAGLGAGLGTVLRGGRNVAMASSILATYLFLMGGGFTTIAFLPQWLRTLSALDPMRYAIDGLREALFYPDLTGFTADLAVLTGTAVGATVVGAVMVVRSWRR